MDEPDTTEAVRRELIPQMPTELLRAVDRGEKVWNTAEAKEEFEFLRFDAPFVTVRRRSDEVLGSLYFTHSPRVYFGWLEHK